MFFSSLAIKQNVCMILLNALYICTSAESRLKHTLNVHNVQRFPLAARHRRRRFENRLIDAHKTVCNTEQFVLHLLLAAAAVWWYACWLTCRHTFEPNGKLPLQFELNHFNYWNACAFRWLLFVMLRSIWPPKMSYLLMGCRFARV